jgi:ABC-type siderophore export system fused ATPase/permease subunit
MIEQMLREMKPELVFVLVIVGMSLVVATVVSLVSVVATAWRKTRRDEMIYELKREMLERGMSAEEIERVVRAEAPAFGLPSAMGVPWWSCGHKHSRRHAAPAGPAR